MLVRIDEFNDMNIIKQMLVFLVGLGRTVKEFQKSLAVQEPRALTWQTLNYLKTTKIIRPTKNRGGGIGLEKITRNI